MNGSAVRQSPESRMNACCSSPVTRPTSNIRSPRFIRSRTIAATPIAYPPSKLSGVAAARPPPATKQEVGGGRAAWNPTLLALPHQRPFPPAVPQLGEFVGVVGPDA